MCRNWLAVASAEHVRRGRESGFMQVCHGKKSPLMRIHPGDTIIYYSPTVSFGGADKLKAFTAIGTVKNGEAYQVDMGDGFCPFRRDVAWYKATEAFIFAYLDELEFTKGRRNWGYPLRFGLLLISDHDAKLIAQAMNVVISL
ncbi:EVE domain-containing protein [Legionella quateirensis]|uniref:UPF0310 protein Lqua_2254 n=1 Tax=Legionella quateirensis TaxID=45072 RepID=A0A378KTN6_9GAMM|nr:EVE domain-containing protein [Legionella quateirensis]KTD47860.1 hypothetical protein Lqua_2254 [Legionella quateirensis]STY16758.1 EVE domain [Legionella quateirensis]